MKNLTTKIEGKVRPFLEDKSSATMIHSMVYRQTENYEEDGQVNTAGEPRNSKMTNKKASQSAMKSTGTAKKRNYQSVSDLDRLKLVLLITE
jgi:hypothetical protein